MTGLGAVVTLVLAVLVLALPRPLAALPVLLAVLYTPRELFVEIGVAHLTALQIVIAAGCARALVQGLRFAGGLATLDLWVLACALVFVALGAYHAGDGFVFRAGMVWNELGAYVLFRVFLRGKDDVRRLLAALCVAVVPLAVLMLLEKVDARNFFEALGSSADVTMRAGTDQVRARGPFAHAILAGSVGALCIGFAVAVWRRDTGKAVVGALAAVVIVVASTSSGPVMMAAAIVGAILLYRVRRGLPAVCWLALVAVVVLQLVMNDPVYFLMAKIDITGGSQGWYRAQLIRSALEHLDEWWLAGTDYTRHWMPSGTHANDVQADITNHYLQVGVWGGLPLLFLFIGMLTAAFRAAIRAYALLGRCPPDRFLVWCLSAVLFGLVTNMLSIALFDQSVVFLYLVLAAIATVCHERVRARAWRAVPVRVTRSTTPHDVVARP